MKTDDQMIEKIAEVIRSSEKYVNLNIVGNALTTIPPHVFGDCETIVSITIPKIVTKNIETNLTADWASEVESGTVRYSGLDMGKTLKEEVNKETKVKEKIVVNLTEDIIAGIWIYTDEDKVIRRYNLTNNSVIFVENGQKVKKGEPIAKRITLPAIGSTAFIDCTNLKSVTIGNGVTSIESMAFQECTSLTSIIIPDSVTSIGSQAFMDCTNLKSVTTGNGVTSIGFGSFWNCTSLTSIIIPESVTGIRAQAFLNCANLTNVTFQGTISPNNLDRYAFSFPDKNNRLYYNDILDKYIAGGPGTYTTTAPVNENSKWTKQPDSSNKSISTKKSSGKVSAFPGRWQLIEGRGDAKEVELFKDGTGTADGNGITWKIENGRFHILHPFYTFSAYYNVTGSTITFTQDNGTVVKYQKK